MTGYSSQNRQQAAAAGARGTAARSFESHCRQIIAEYDNNALGTMGVTLELKAALRDLDRRKPQNQGAGRS